MQLEERYLPLSAKERSIVVGTTCAPRITGRRVGERDVVSVIVVNHNGMRFVEGLFLALSRQTYRNFEVLFFDNASTDDSVGFVKRSYPSVRIFMSRKNDGFSRPNNDGIRESRGEFVLALNLDVDLEASFIERLVKAVQRDEMVGWAAGRMYKLQRDGRRSRDIDCLGHHLGRDRYAKEIDYSRPFSWDYYSKNRYVFGASACAVLYRRAMLEDVAVSNEYFDEDFAAYWEDVDLDWRAQLMGWKCLYVSNAIGYHVRGGSGLIASADVMGHYVANRFLLLIKNDETKHLLQDIVPFMSRSAGDFRRFLKRNPHALLRAAVLLSVNLPKAVIKRRTIHARKRVDSRYMRTMIR